MDKENNILDYPVTVKLLRYTADPESLIEFAGRLCWDSQDKTGTTPDRIERWINIGHESVIEHSSATFHIWASRTFTHQLVRHRIASFSQRSQKYVNESIPKYIIPAEISNAESISMDTFIEAMEHAWKYYNLLLGQGMKKEIARYVLPEACETQIIMTMNFRELRHFIKLRTSRMASPEMRCVAYKIRNMCKEFAPQVFKDV